MLDRTLRDIRGARRLAGMSHDQMAAAIGRSASAYGRFELNQLEDVGIVFINEVASVLGLEVSIGLHLIGDPVRDKGQLACGRRFEAILADRWRVTDETLLPGVGEQRAWDKLLRLVGESPPYVVGVDIESRVHDVQAIVRRTRGRERDGHANHILIVLADTAHNRRVLADLRQALGPPYATGPRAILAALRQGGRLPGSGVVLI